MKHPDAFYGYTGPGYVEEIWLLDVAGTRLMIAAERSADSSPATIAEMREILASIRIEPGGFPSGLFADLGEQPVSDELAAKLQAMIDTWADGEQGGLTATLFTPAGRWSGAAGIAAGDRAMTPDDQMAIASLTKTVMAAQVMRLVEAGELHLADLAADRLPPDLEFDTNAATIDDLLSMRSGIPDWVDPNFWESLTTDPLHAWTTEEVLALVGPERTPVGQAWNYSSTNYALLGLIVEHVTGRTLAEVLRDGVLGGGEYERMIYQPDEQPADPMAMPFGAAADTFGAGGGYLPSVAGATSAGPAGAMAADSLTVASWWRALCAGEIVSVASVDEMTDFVERPEYGLGIAEMSEEDGRGAVGHGGSHVGFKSWALCLPELGTVVVALTNSSATRSMTSPPRSPAPPMIDRPAHLSLR